MISITRKVEEWVGVGGVLCKVPVWSWVLLVDHRSSAVTESQSFGLVLRRLGRGCSIRGG